MPTLPANKIIRDGFPTSIAKVVNASLPPVKYTIHHMAPWMAKFMVAEFVDIHNLKVLLAFKAPLRIVKRTGCILRLFSYYNSCNGMRHCFANHSAALLDLIRILSLPLQLWQDRRKQDEGRERRKRKRDLR